MNIIKFKCNEAETVIHNCIEEQQYGFAYCIHDKKSILIPTPDAVDRELCANLGYYIMETQHSGGVVVVGEGDVSIIHFGLIGNDAMARFTKRLIQEYKNRGLNAIFDGNDILIDGYKISGLSATPYGSTQYSTMHVGINTNIEDIKAICTKPMVKIPKGLADYNISAEEIEHILLDFCKNYK